MQKPSVGNISAAGIIYKESDPSQIFVETKDSGYPVKVFRNCICLIGGNYIGDGAKSDQNPCDTFLRESDEELSFEKKLITQEEYEKIGIFGGKAYHAAACKKEPATYDVFDLCDLKAAIRERARHFVDSIQHVPKSVFASADQTSKRDDLTGLNSCWAVPLDDDTWETLFDLQDNFGNLSNESISFLTSLNEILTSNIRCSWGYDRILQKFFLEHGLAEAENMAMVPGVEVKFLGEAMPSYGHYFQKFRVANHPFAIDLKSLVRTASPDASDERRDIFDFLGAAKDFPAASHGNLIYFKNRVPGKPWVAGNHWHNDHERFMIVAGTMPKTILENIATGEREVWRNLGPGTVIDIPRWVAHAFEPAEEVVLMGTLKRPFNSKDLNEYLLMDKVSCEILPSPF